MFKYTTNSTRSIYVQTYNKVSQVHLCLNVQQSQPRSSVSKRTTNKAKVIYVQTTTNTAKVIYVKTYNKHSQGHLCLNLQQNQPRSSIFKLQKSQSRSYVKTYNKPYQGHRSMSKPTTRSYLSKP
jgi:hypothetical protein